MRHLRRSGKRKLRLQAEVIAVARQPTSDLISAITWCGIREDLEAYRAPPPKPSMTISPLLPWMLKNGCSEMAVGARIDSKIAPLPEENWKTCCDMDGPCAGTAKEAAELESEPATGKGLRPERAQGHA